MGKLLVRFQEGPENNGDMGEMMWHRRESRRQTEKTNITLQSPKTPVYSNFSRPATSVVDARFSWPKLVVEARSVRTFAASRASYQVFRGPAKASAPWLMRSLQRFELFDELPASKHA